MSAVQINDVVKRWQASMAPHMETHEDLRPIAEPLEEVFRLD